MKVWENNKLLLYQSFIVVINRGYIIIIFLTSPLYHIHGKYTMSNHILYISN